MVVASAALAHVFDQSTYTYITKGLSCAGRVPTMVGAKKVP